MAKLSKDQLRLLTAFLSENYKRIQESDPSSTDVTSWAREALGFDIDSGNITHLIGPNGVRFTHHWPRSEITRQVRLTDKLKQNLLIQQVELIRADLCRLATNLGASGYGRRLKEWDDIVALAARDVLDTDVHEDSL